MGWGSHAFYVSDSVPAPPEPSEDKVLEQQETAFELGLCVSAERDWDAEVKPLGDSFLWFGVQAYRGYGYGLSYHVSCQ